MNVIEGQAKRNEKIQSDFFCSLTFNNILNIIVMLILVMVSISIALNTGLFDAAGKATQRTNIAKEGERELAEGKVNIDGTTYNNIDEYVDDIILMPTIGKGEIAKSKSKYIDNNGKKAVIPKGFTVSGIPSEATIDKGLVIYDIPEEDLKDGTVDWTDPETVKPNYNQFVWIPVEVNKTIDTESSIVSFPTVKVDGYVTEPYAYDDKDYDGESGTGIKNKITELTASVYNYGGFYFGRYEAGSSAER